MFRNWPGHKMKNTILIVDDDRKINQLLVIRLRKQGYVCASVFDGAGALPAVREHSPSLVFLDLRLPDMSGTEVLRSILKAFPEIYVVMISAHADVQLAVECIKTGAYDFIEKPFEFEAFDIKVKQIFRQINLQEEVTALKRELGAAYKYKSLVGSSDAMKKVYQAITLAAKSDVNVLILGESGTGKELVARSIHGGSEQKDRPFIAVNCGAIPENLLESELFGHEKGSFTGAAARKIGKFEQAQGGTIFLDEIGDLPLSLQVKLLRVLQEREIERVGGSQPIPIQVRLMTATHRDLKKMVDDKLFREDLYYRINVFPIRVPPLRERKEDIAELFMHFVNTRRKGDGGLKTDPAALVRLADYDWPGNIRELENFVERLLLLLGDRKNITEKDIHELDGLAAGEAPTGSASSVSTDRVTAMGETEKAILERALAEAGGNVSKACRIVKMSRDSFYRKIKKYSILR